MFWFIILEYVFLDRAEALELLNLLMKPDTNGKLGVIWGEIDRQKAKA